MAMQLAGFETTYATHRGTTRTVFRRGTGPAVIVMHEIPGITPFVADFARIVADAGFTVYLPHLFGVPGKPARLPYVTRSLVRACIGREFVCLAKGSPSPITDWIRDLCHEARDACGGPGVGAVGMCLTGNFALALMVDDVVAAPVLSQPSLPFPVPLTGAKHDLAIDEDQLRAVKARVDAGCPVLGLRFHGDPLCPGERFDRLRKELGEGFEAIEIDPAHANPTGNKPPHSVLTTDLIDEEGQPTREARDRVLSFFAERLKP